MPRQLHPAAPEAVARLPTRGWLAACLGFLAGTLWQGHQPELWGGAAYLATLTAAALASAVLGLRVRALPGRWPVQGVAFGLALVLAFGLAGARAVWRAQDRLAPELEGRDLWVTGVVSAMPQRLDGGLRLRLEVESAVWAGESARSVSGVPRALWLGWYGALPSTWGLAEDADSQPASAKVVPDVRAGERWRLTVRLKQAHGQVNPHGFDHELWLWEQGLLATGYVRTGPRDRAPERLGDTGLQLIERARQSVRDAVWRQLLDAHGVPAPHAGVVAALVTGDQRAIERADWDVFRATGVAHLMSISGLHITMLAWLAQSVLAWLWRQTARWGGASGSTTGGLSWGAWCLRWPAPTVGAWAGVGVASLYALFCGWGVPAQRTVVMLVTVTLLRSGARRWPWPLMWAAAMTVVLALDPWALWQPGFWLSFVAVGLLFATDDRSPAGSPLWPGEPAAQLTGWRRVWALRAWSPLAGLLREQLVLTAALTPLTLLLFGQVSLIGVAANLVAIPWVTLVVTPLALAGALWSPLWWGATWAVQGLWGGLQACAQWPWATWSVAAAPVWAGVAGVVGGGLMAVRLPWPWRLMGVPLLLPVLTWQPPVPPEGRFELLAADVGQGNALLVRTAGHALVYDAGPRYSRESDAGDRVLVPLLRALAVRVDQLMISHKDVDHAGGAQAVLSAHPNAEVRSSLAPGHALLGGRIGSRCEAGQQWTWDGVRFDVLHPQASDYDVPGVKSNALSCVLRVSDAWGRAALLVGDIELPQERALLARGGELAADVLLVPHHGSRTSSGPVFLDVVHPRIALVQAGYRNRFGHPVPEVMARYEQRGIRVLASPSCGAIRWRSEHPEAWGCERLLTPRYWRARHEGLDDTTMNMR